MSKITYRQGNAEIRMDDTLERMVRQVIENVAPATVRAMDEHVGGLHEDAEGQWPVKTGYSRAQLSYGIVVERDRIIAYIRNTSGYARFIKARNLGGKRPWTQLVLGPSKKRRAELAEIAGRELLAAHEVS